YLSPGQGRGAGGGSHGTRHTAPRRSTGVSVIEAFRRNPGSAPVADCGPSIEHQLAALHALQHEHPLWNCRLLTAFAQGALSREDIRYVFSQYHLYTSNFTRFIAAVMASCESDLFRAQLAQNLWEEGGGCEPSRRHAQIFRNFLRDSLGIADAADIAYAPHTHHFVREYLAQAQRAEPVAGAAFLAIGTEGIVSRMYQIMRTGLVAAGIPESELEFFDIHIACDDDHAVTLENMMMSYAGQPGWFDTCAAAMRRALDLRLEFFDSLYADLQQVRLAPIMLRMQN